MSKPIIRFLGALVMLGAILAGVISSFYYQAKIDNSISSKHYIAEQFKDSVEGITIEDVMRAHTKADQVYENAGTSLIVIYGICILIFVAGMFLVIVAPFSKDAKLKE